ncbi:uridine 5'-monophosphate synthase-like [Stegodyphus dumicola]|uniref:uridine 5'-monophosphate synthase-like n=1 Tax=Stegodyphus dumicola TaxID=202533 RepID=UPI0015A89FE3|nr:uridine 5'-monophosphate synthase-like [Stegodyphus dumicola]
MAKKTELLLRLVNIGVLKIGEWTLKSGVISPIYVDLRHIIHYPDLVHDIAEAVHQKQVERKLKVDVLCGVPYTALPIASVLSVLHNIPMVLRRKEAKSYGTKKMVEGVLKEGGNCLIIEDIVSSGSSVLETAETLRKEGLIVTDCIVVLNRMQGGLENLEKEGICLHSLFDIHDIFDSYCTVNKVETTIIENVKLYLETNAYIPVKKLPQQSKFLTFAEKAEKVNHPVVKKLFKIILKKKSNLCVAVDTIHAEELLKLVGDLGPYVCMIKTHIDILMDFNESVTEELTKLAKKHDFLLFEDRKFADIGNTVMYQYESGLYKIKQWADIVTVHGLPGSGIITALKNAAEDYKDRACVLIAEMSSKGALTNNAYKESIIEMAENHPDFVIGFVSQHKFPEKDAFIYMCPGVNIKHSGDTLGQQYKSPEEAVKDGADVIIVGRGICNSDNVIQTAKLYQTRAFSAYQKCIQ